jgi:site-specific DNA recombinase
VAAGRVTARRLQAVPDAGPLRFAAAVRVSRVGGRSGERFHSPETQVAGAARAAAAAGGHIDRTVGDDGVFYDLDVSGAVAPSDRPGLGQALELVRSGRLAGVAVFDLSRWSRDTVSGLRELEEIAACGGQVVSASESIDLATPGGVFATTVQLAANAMRRAEAAKAWRETHESRYERGLVYGRLPMGYTADADGAAVVDPLLGPALTRAFEQYAAGTATTISLAADLSQVRGRRTSPNTVSRLLRHPFYAGQVSYDGQSKLGRHAPLVDPQTWAAVQRRLAGQPDGMTGVRAAHSLTGLVLCGRCDRPLHRRGLGGQRRDAEQLEPRLGCRHPGCPGVGTPRVREVEQLILDEVLAMASGLRDRAPEFDARESRSHRAQADLVRLRAEHAATLDAIGQAGAARARGLFDDLSYQATVSTLRVDLDRLAGQIEASERTAGPGPTLPQLEDLAARLREEWHAEDGMTGVEKRLALGMFLRAVRLHPPVRRGGPVSGRLHFDRHELT